MRNSSPGQEKYKIGQKERKYLLLKERERDVKIAQQTA